MKLSSKIHINTLPILLVVICLLGTAEFLFHKKLHNVAKMDMQVSQLGKAVSEINILTEDFLRNHSLRALEQLEERRNTLAGLIKMLDSASKEEYLLITSIKNYYDDLETVFKRLSSIHKIPHSPAGNHSFLELDKRLSEQMLIFSQEMVTDTVALKTIFHKRMLSEFLQEAVVLMFLLLLIMVLSLIANNVLIRKTVIGPIEKLILDTRIIGNGKLDHRVTSISADEIGELARSFDSMARNLSAITVSRDELYKEMTVRKQAEKDLLGERHFSQALIDTMQAILLVLSPDGKIRSINPFMEELSGYKLSEVKGKDWFETFLPAQDREKIHEVFRDAIGDIQTQGFINSIVSKDGRLIPIEWYDKTMKNNEGEVFGLVSIGLDITERMHAAEMLQKTNDQLVHAEKLSAIGKLSASIAHEFNNPIQGILNILKGISNRASLDEDDAELMTIAVDECYRMRNLIRSLQDFNRPTSGRTRSIDIHAELDSLLLLGKKAFKTDKIKIEKRYCENMPPITVVADQIKQVFLNLLNNASDACSAGGTITIETGVAGDNVIVRIIDTGTGIKPEDMDHVFEPFFSTKPEVIGTGLGLSICYGIIKEHGGEIVITNNPDKGATSTVLLPISGVHNAEQKNTVG